ncbi:hypothetical protein CDD82_6842 [Ophiocordyceps australis]|uniref:Carbohydrate-binding module family 19 domain-containing protein n=1 Tax=Ophiocordyceps australis TaxID=1399860 RepID=A0A2C5ZQP1_9HYPO|nr:hypothetical protein CDD82_6842 [Ophiocordyceps australis]
MATVPTTSDVTGTTLAETLLKPSSTLPGQPGSAATSTTSFLAEGPVPTATYPTTAPALLRNASTVATLDASSRQGLTSSALLPLSLATVAASRPFALPLNATVATVVPLPQPLPSTIPMSPPVVSASLVPTRAPPSSFSPAPLSSHSSTGAPVSSTPSPTARPLPQSPTGHANPSVPTLNLPLSASPTAALSAAGLAANVAQARALNAVFAGLTARSACQGTQVACVQGRVARCVGSAFEVDGACQEGRRCLAMPMTNVGGAWIGCVDVDEARRMLGEDQAAAMETRVTQTAIQTAKRPIVTLTTVVTVVDDSSAAPTLPYTSGPDAPASISRPAQLASHPPPASQPVRHGTVMESIQQLSPASLTGSVDKATDGASRATLTVNGTPIVSVFVTVTVTAKERETVTLIVPAS